MCNQCEYVLIAVTRKYFTPWLQGLVLKVFGYEVPAKWPLRWVLYRQLSAREQMKMREDLHANKTPLSQRVNHST